MGDRNQKNKKMNRILALDVMRGITIVGMIVFNTCSGYHYAPLYHAPWIGLTLADMAFPLFMFIMGITTFLALDKYGFAPSHKVFRKIAGRTLGIIVVCWLFDWFGRSLFGFCYADPSVPFLERLWHACNNLEHLRLSGVLVRLGLCYGACALFSLYVSHRRFPVVIVAILVAYWIILLAGNGFERSAVNVLGIVDRGVLGVNHMCNDGGIDPEGVLSTLPGIAHVMLGFWVGSVLFAGRGDGSNADRRLLFVLLTGAFLLIVGYLLGLVCPVSKKIWSPSFVMITCGVGALLLGLLIYYIDIRGKGRGFASAFRVFGANPLFLYLLSEGILWPLELIKVNVCGGEQDLWGVIFWRGLVPLFGNEFGDFVFAMLNVAFCGLVGWVMYRKRIFVKL